MAIRLNMYKNYKLGASNMIFGKDSLEHLKTLDAKKVFIVTSGSTLKKLKFEERIINYLKEAGAEVMVFGEVESDPSFKSVFKGSREMLTFKPDWIIGLGGGSAMDAAKGMWALYENEFIEDLKTLVDGTVEKSFREKARLCCIPSTSGTGSEVTRATVITDETTNIKYGFGDPKLRLVPDLAILDPTLTLSMPPNLTAATGMDVVTHALEAFISNKTDIVSDMFAKEAFGLALNNLVTAYNTPDDFEARSNMLLASALAGIAFSNGGLGMVHSISHAVGGLYNVPHGLANAVALPKVLEHYLNVSEEIKDKLSKLDADILETIKSLNKALNIPDNFNSIIPNLDSNEAIPKIVELALADSNTNNAPLVPSDEEMKEIVSACLK